MMKDAMNQKLWSNTPKENQALWRQQVAVESHTINIDNIAVKAAVNLIPGIALPSGTNFSLFLDRVIYEF